MGVQTFAGQLEDLPSLHQMLVPDLWQQEAITALRQGRDVVVHAPTGAGKTLIFELWSNQGKPRGQAVYTVPTRALANDKLAEWRARGWNVGIATGDLAENLEAPVIVATLETQKHRLIRGEGPDLLVVDEYQMLGDGSRGLNYELSIALAPSRTQLLLLSGSVENPHDVVRWLRNLGRNAMMVRHEERPVPQEEVYAHQLNYHVPNEVRGYWPRLAAKVLAEDLGPLLLFAPRRQMAEALASELARHLPIPNPLQLSPEQKALAGETLAKMLKSRIAYHHSGLSYGARAGVIEPLAKAGQLRVVVATMGLAAGINFSLRSVALAADSYRRDQLEQPLRPDEILQMFGRAGRRGIDETGYVIVSSNEIRLMEAHTSRLSRNGMVDWSALLGVMQAAAVQGKPPFAEAVRVQARLFSSKPIFLGVEESLRHPDAPCGLQADPERARHVRKRIRQILNSRGEWENHGGAQDRVLGEVWASPSPEAAVAGKPLELHPVLSVAEAVERHGTGVLSVVGEDKGRPVYGRLVTVAEVHPDDRLFLFKWSRRLSGWHGRQASRENWDHALRPALEKGFLAQRTPIVAWEMTSERIAAKISLAQFPVKVPVDSHGVALWKPKEREVIPADCTGCALVPVCRQLPTATGTVVLWRRLGLVSPQGVPTRRGRIVSFFSQGDGLAIAAALEDSRYAIDELAYDLANLDAGFRFCGDENRWAGRLPLACQRLYGLASIPGYLENGSPPDYGAGAERIASAVHANPESKRGWITDALGTGDIDRMIIEWRSLLRQVAHAPDLEWDRWKDLQERARALVAETESPTLTELPPLEYHQTRRVEHKLILRRH